MSNDTRTSAPSPRIIERWFPCAEVSAASGSGWGSSNSETLLMSWFAKRPLAQSRAAVLCSLLPWPDYEAEQKRVQAVIREALGACQDPGWYACRDSNCDKPEGECNRKSHLQVRGPSDPHAFGIEDCAKEDPTGGYNAARSDVLKLLKEAYPDRPAEMLDPFAGRGLIPIEAARYGQHAHAIDYSPVATLASRLLIDWPFRDWSSEPELPFDPPPSEQSKLAAFDPHDPQRLIRDIEIVQYEVQRRIERELDEYYPDNEHGEKPWGYLWASVIPCDGCGREFPLYGSNVLRKPNRNGNPASSFEIQTSEEGWRVRVVDGVTGQPPTMRARQGKRGKLAWCPFSGCGHAHEKPEHKRLSNENYHHVEMLVVADLVGSRKIFREPTNNDRSAAAGAASDLESLELHGLPARPNEPVPIGTDAVVAGLYGAKSFGDLCVPRQNLLHAHIARAVASIGQQLQEGGHSTDFASALAGYCAASLAKKLRRSTRGARLEVMSNGGNKVGDIFSNESSIAFNYDFFEPGIGSGPGTWSSVSGTPTALGILTETDGRPAHVRRGSALSQPFGAGALDAVITDPPYDMMIDYSDSSDVFYVWQRRALAGLNPDFAMTSHPGGVQEKLEEIIIKRHYNNLGDHRTPDHYKTKIAEAFSECRRTVARDGVVTIIFGHGDPEAWRKILDAIADAGLVLTGAWPANTEKGGLAGSANINTTLTLACRPAPTNRPDGRAAEVDAEMRKVIADRVKNVWGPSGLSYVDQKMAAAGPALEVVGRYERILDKKGQPVDLTRYLPLARQAVTEAHDLRFDSLPLETFDQKTRFALEWAKAYGRRVQAASEARWQRLAADLEEHETEGVLKDVDQGVRLITAKEAKVEPVNGMPLFEVALAAAAAWKSGSLADAATAIRTSGVDPQDQHFWAVLNALSKAFPETDVDGASWTSMVRNRDALAAGVANAEAALQLAAERTAVYEEQNPRMFEDPDSLFGQEEN